MYAFLTIISAASGNVVCPADTHHRVREEPRREEWCELLGRFPFPVKHGPFARWWKNGRLEVEGQYVEGEFHDTLTYWDEGGGGISDVERYDHGVLDGLTESFDPLTGVKLFEIRYERGSKHGIAVSWHHNGRLAGVTQWRKGIRHGAWNEWDSNGTLRNTGLFLDDLPAGKWVYRDAAGSPLLNLEYENGRLLVAERDAHSPVLVSDLDNSAPYSGEAISAFVRMKAPSLSRCFQIAESTGADIPNGTRVKWIVDIDKVQRFKLLESSAHEMTVARCIAETISNWEFPYCPYATYSVEAQFGLR